MNTRKRVGKEAARARARGGSRALRSARGGREDRESREQIDSFRADSRKHQKRLIPQRRTHTHNVKFNRLRLFLDRGENKRDREREWLSFEATRLANGPLCPVDNVSCRARGMMLLAE